MTSKTLYLTGNQIGTYDSLSSGGNGDDMAVTLNGTRPLGGAEDVYRLEIIQVGEGVDDFSNGQFVSIYPYPESDPPAEPIVTRLNPQHDMFQGRASSEEHQIFTSPENYVIDLNGVSSGSMQYRPGLEPPRAEQLPFSGLPSQPPSVPCFAAGTLIAAEGGLRPVEEIAAGDRVMTRDAGLQSVRWAGQARLPGRGALAPVEIAAGALGNTRSLRVSQQHRLLVTGWRAELLFGQPEVLVAARHLVNDRTIRICPCDEITYVHLALDSHAVLEAEGLGAESLYLGPGALASMPHAARAELLAIFPGLEEEGPMPLARPGLRGWEGALLAP
ncbi:Hint domain-containing protein [Pseudoroseicyclus tamaricis]|uniref:Hint domain-containing protein n=1 Tax=Pseudoroseicyclus tamaricis TaxID=2705421 RepID=A0A6B2JSK0_9RHOB|nr:Hint domain-containing protein [Pseudoroseicyclus tamaricis]NDV01537.1 Hint domain-containing protein [Pseudoroseicyclus tamaricis]